MKTRSIGLISILLNAAFCGAIFFLAQKPADSSHLSAPATETGNGIKTNRKERNKFARSVVNQTATNAVGSEFNWATLQARDFRTYIANLRAIECPEETIRDIIVAEVDKLYAGQLRALIMPGQESSYWKSQRHFNTRESYDAQKKRRDLEKEKSDLLVELLGVDPQKESNKEMGVTDYWSRMYSFLPESKQEQARTVQEKYEEMKQEIYRRGELDDKDWKEMREIYKKQLDEMGQFLTPGELEQYELATSQTAIQMRYDLDGLEPSAEEFRAIYKIKKAHEEELAYNYDPDDKEAQKRRENAVKETNKEIASVINPDRYAEYERLQDWNYKELVRLATKENLPKETAIKAFDLKKSAEQSAVEIRGNKDLTQQQRNAALKELRDNTEKEFTTNLGDKAYNKYKKRYGWWLNNISNSK